MNAPPSSYEMLVAYADGELDRADRELMLTLLDMDAELSREAWALCKVKDMIDVSYQQVEMPRSVTEPVKPRCAWLPGVPIAVCLLVLGYVLFNSF